MKAGPWTTDFLTVGEALTLGQPIFKHSVKEMMMKRNNAASSEPDAFMTNWMAEVVGSLGTDPQLQDVPGPGALDEHDIEGAELDDHAEQDMDMREEPAFQQNVLEVDPRKELHFNLFGDPVPAPRWPPKFPHLWPLQIPPP